MRLLLDTQVYLWFVADAPRLALAARHAIDDAESVFVSAASICVTDEPEAQNRA